LPFFPSLLFYRDNTPFSTILSSHSPIHPLYDSQCTLQPSPSNHCTFLKVPKSSTTFTAPIHPFNLQNSDPLPYIPENCLSNVHICPFTGAPNFLSLHAYLCTFIHLAHSSHIGTFESKSSTPFCPAQLSHIPITFPLISLHCSFKFFPPIPQAVFIFLSFSFTPLLPLSLHFH